VIDTVVTTGALLAGLLGGLHCLAMCGGIATGLAMAVPRQQALAAALRLNLGRVLGYTLAGALAGGLGAGLLSLARLEPLQWGMRLAVGLILVLAAARILWPRRRLPGNGFGQRLWQGLQPLHRHLLPADTALRQLGAGALWGWLPCGLSATLLSAAWLSADALQGGVLMAAFGLGTWLTLLPLTWSGTRVAGLMQHRAARRGGAALLFASGLITLSAPWLAQWPAAHALLERLGCRSLP
jgi:sulfite exporter TauE/SafE